MVKQLFQYLFQNKFWQNQVIQTSFVAALLINIILWLILLSNFGTSEEIIPLHFSVVYGINFLGPAYLAYELPLIGIVFFVINLAFSKMIFEPLNLFSQFLAVATVAFEFIILVNVLVLVSLL